MAKGSSGFDKNGSKEKLDAPPKVGEEVYVKDWFRSKIDLPQYVHMPRTVEILEERGKAYKVGIDADTVDGERTLYFKRFIPKSVVQTKAQVEHEEKEERKRYEDGQKKYAKMIDFAKKNGVNGVRVGLRKETILEKIRKSGFDYKY